MRLERYYTSERNDDIFASFETKHISIEICHKDSERRFCLPEFEVPAHWSKRAAEHLAHHYLRRTGVPSALLSVAEEGVPEWLWRSEEDTIRLSEMDESQRYKSETSYRQIVRRLVGAWTYWGWVNDYFDTEGDAKAFYDEMAHLIVMQQAMPASPQWCNTGLHWAYGISGDAQGGVYVDSHTGDLTTSKSAYERPQHHHCFIQSVRDDLSGEGGITDLWQREMRVFKHASASGCNMSNIRSEAETLSNGMRPAGLVPFMDIGEKAAQVLSAAAEHNGSRSKLSLIDSDHPDLLRVLHWRLAEHRDRIANAIGTAKQRAFFQKIHSAIRLFVGADEQRYDPTINSELGEVIESIRQRDVSDTFIMQYVEELRACASEYSHFGERILSMPTFKERTVSRLGLRASDAFMRAANGGENWSFKQRTDGEETQTVSASALLDEMAYLNWMTGDGLLQFSDSVEFWNGCKATTPIEASSPGGEFLFLNDSACDVAVINLAHYVTDSGSFDIPAFEHTVRMQTIMCDIAITMAQFPSSEVAYNSYRYRPIGLSFCNLSALLMAMGYAYDSAESRAIGAAIASLMTGRGYVTSAEIARELGGFEAFSEVRESMMQLMWQHHEAAFGRTQHLGSADICPSVIDHGDLPESELSDAVQKIWDLAMIQGDEFGYSNAQISLIASSPNIMILMDAMTPGIAPLSSFDHLESGSKVMASGLQKLGYQPSQIEMITHYVFGHQTLFGAPGINQQALRLCGFTDTEMTLIEDALQQGQSVHMAFDPLHLGERFCRETLGLNDTQLHDADFKLLHHLGFDDDVLEAFERHINGHATVAGAPYLRSEDYAIFALADPQSEHAISMEAQIQMAAGIQPYISGGIAHHFITPAKASVKDHRRWMVMAWQLGLKHIELSRQESEDVISDIAQDVSAKLPQALPQSQPALHSEPAVQKFQAPQVTMPKLGIDQSEIIGMVKLELEKAVAKHVAAQPVKQVQPTPAAPAPTAQFTAKTGKASTAHRATKRALPSRRSGYVQDAQIGGVLVRHRVEEYEDGSLGVVHLELPDCEINLQQALQQSAQVLSIALQHGVPIEAFESLASETAYSPQGAVSGHHQVSQVQSVMDYLLQDVLPLYQEQLAPAGQPNTDMRDMLNLSDDMLSDAETTSDQADNNRSVATHNVLS